MKNHRQTGKSGTRAARQAGISLTETILGIAIMGGGLGLIAKLQKDNIDRINNQVAAHQMATIRTAAERYVRDNYAAVLGMVPATGNTATIPDNDLRNWLPDSMFNGAEIAPSPYNGDYVINVRNVGPGASGQPRVEMTVVTTGGKPIPESALPQVAADLGANGGFRAATNALYDTATVRGAYGGWQMPVADLATAPAPGSVVGFAYFGDGAVLTDFLYRNPVPGQPEAQRMNANIDSNNFGLANVAQIGGNVDTANPANAPVAPPANTVRFGGVTGGTNGFARADVSIQANNINAANLAAQGDVAVFDANNVERGRMSGATRSMTLGAAPGGATTVVADGTGQTVTVRDGVRDRTQLTGTGQVRGFDAAGTETVRADAVAQNIRVGNAAGNRAEMTGTGQVRGFDAAGAETLRADAVAQNIRVGNTAGNRTEMTGGGLFSAYDNTGVLRARISGNDGSLRLSNDTGEKITADASTQRLAMRNAANNETIVADGAGQTVTVRDGARDRAQITSAGILQAWDNDGLLRARVDAGNGSLTLNRNNAGVAQESLFMDGNNTSIRFGSDFQNTDTIALTRADNGFNNSRLMLQIGDDEINDDAFEIGTRFWNGGAWRPTMTANNSGTLSAKSPLNSGFVSLSPGDGGIEIASGNDNFSYIDFRGNGNLGADFSGRIGYSDAGSQFNISGPPTPANPAGTNANVRVGTPQASPVSPLGATNSVLDVDDIFLRGRQIWLSESLRFRLVTIATVYNGGWVTPAVPAGCANTIAVISPNSWASPIPRFSINGNGTDRGGWAYTAVRTYTTHAGGVNWRAYIEGRGRGSAGGDSGWQPISNALMTVAVYCFS